MPVGGTVAFCRGGSFDASGSRQWVNNNCRADNRCVIRDYTPPGSSTPLPRPILNAGTDYGISLEDGGNSNHEEGYTLLNLELRGAGSANGIRASNDIDDVLACNLVIDNFELGFYVTQPRPPANIDPGSDGRNSRIVLRNSIIKNNHSQGWLGTCDDCGIEYNYFENNGWDNSTANDAQRDHNIYLDNHNSFQGMRVVGNELYRSAMLNGECTGVSLVVHGGVHNNLLIEGNTIREDIGAAEGRCWGISVDAGYASEGEAFNNIIIRNNTVMNVGNQSIGVNACQNCLIENNLVIQQQNANGSLISAPVRTDEGSNDQAMDSVTIRNNTLFINSAANYTGIRLGYEGSNHSAYNNVLYARGGGQLTCFNYDLSAGSYATRDNNVCFATGGSSLRWTNSETTLNGWRNQSGADSASMAVDPQFTSLAVPYNFTPSATSPLRNAAISSPVDDNTGKLRDANPDIGAFER